MVSMTLFLAVVAVTVLSRIPFVLFRFSKCPDPSIRGQKVYGGNVSTTSRY